MAAPIGLVYPVRAADPDADAFAAIYTEHRDQVRLFIRRLTSADVADDLAQETFLRAWRTHPELADMDTEWRRRWLYTIARRITIDWRRLQSRREFTPIADYNGREGTLGDPENEVVDRVLVAGMRDAIRALAPQQRLGVVLRYLCDMTIEQTAEVMRCSPGAVKSSTHAGLRNLAAALDDQPETIRRPR